MTFEVKNEYVKESLDILAMDMGEAIEKYVRKFWNVYLDFGECGKDVPVGTVNPKLFIDTLSKAMPDDSVICADVGQNQIWTCTDYRFEDRGRFITSGGMGTMGY